MVGVVVAARYTWLARRATLDERTRNQEIESARAGALWEVQVDVKLTSALASARLRAQEFNATLNPGYIAGHPFLTSTTRRD